MCKYLSLLLLAAAIGSSQTVVNTYTVNNAPVIYGTNYGLICDGSTDDTTALRAAISAASSLGGAVIQLPKGSCRVTSQIVAPVAANLITLRGASRYGSGLYCDFAPGAKTACLQIYSSGTPRNVSFSLESLTLLGNDNSNLIGVYHEAASPFSVLRDLYIAHFAIGIQGNRTYGAYFENLILENNVDGIVLGQDVGGSMCSNASLDHGTFLNVFSRGNSGYGMVLCSALNYTISGGDVSNNGTAGLYCNNCRGLSVNSLYSEGSTSSHFTLGQIVLDGVKNAVLNGIEISNWYTGTNLVNINNSYAVSINGFSATFGSLKTGYGLLIQNSSGINLDGAYFENISNPIYATGTSRLNATGFWSQNCTTPITWPSDSNAYLDIQPVVSTWISASSLGANSPIVLRYFDGTIQHRYASGVRVTIDPYGQIQTNNASHTLLIKPDVSSAQMGTTTNSPFDIFANSTLAARWTGANLVNYGIVTSNGVAFSSLGTATAGQYVWCSNCNVASPCTSGGSGAHAFANGSAWNCPF